MLFVSVLLCSVRFRGRVVPFHISSVCKCAIYVYVHRVLTVGPEQEAVYDHSRLFFICIYYIFLIPYVNDEHKEEFVSH
jgi:hypothetical protein